MMLWLTADCCSLRPGTCILDGDIPHQWRTSVAYGGVLTDRGAVTLQENPDEVCPAGWKPGDETMKPDPKVSSQ